jgi:hypothetical protein
MIYSKKSIKFRHLAKCRLMAISSVNPQKFSSYLILEGFLSVITINKLGSSLNGFLGMSNYIMIKIFKGNVISGI